MSSRLSGLSFDANDPVLLARFWAGVLGRELAEDAVTLAPSVEIEFPIRLLSTREPKIGPNQMHFDLTSTSLDDQQMTVERALGLGGRHVDVGQRPDEGHVVLADPEGNEFCVIEPGNNFLADTGLIGALSSDGTQAVGYFWSKALDWPLVWDQEEETAIQSPRGGTKITWGGPPVAPKTGKNRLHLDLAPARAGGLDAEVDRLVSIGASRAGAGSCGGRSVRMIDPDGNEFCVLAAY